MLGIQLRPSLTGLDWLGDAHVTRRSDRASAESLASGALRLALTVLVDMTAHTLDRLQLPGPVHVILAGIGAHSLGQTVQTRQLLVPDLLGICGRQSAHRPQERLLSVRGAVKT